MAAIGDAPADARGALMRAPNRCTMVHDIKISAISDQTGMDMAPALAQAFHRSARGTALQSGGPDEMRLP
jgi:hypothetical protein